MTRDVVTDASDIQVHTHGTLTPSEVAYARSKVAHLLAYAPAPVLRASLDLKVHADPALTRPVRAKASFDVNGRTVRAHIAAPSVVEAADRVEDRLHRGLERLAHKPDSVRRRHSPDEWQHGDEEEHRPDYFPRPVEEREVVAHKSYAIGAITAEEAVDEMELLDHDFFLFHDIETDADEVVVRAGDAGYELLSPSPLVPIRLDRPVIEPSETRPTVMNLDDALDLLDSSAARFTFFIDAQSARGHVAYRRYDGHYGLIRPVDENPQPSTERQ